MSSRKKCALLYLQSYASARQPPAGAPGARWCARQGTRGRRNAASVAWRRPGHERAVPPHTAPRSGPALHKIHFIIRRLTTGERVVPAPASTAITLTRQPLRHLLRRPFCYIQTSHTENRGAFFTHHCIFILDFLDRNWKKVQCVKWRHRQTKQQNSCQCQNLCCQNPLFQWIIQEKPFDRTFIETTEA